MELNRYFQIIWRRKSVIILTIIVTMIVVALGTLLMPVRYQVSTILRIAASTSGQFSYTDYTYAPRLMNTYIEIVTSRPVQEELEKRLGLTISPVIKPEIIANTELIKITVEHADPQIAAQAANILADILIEQSTKQYQGGNKSSQELLAEQLAQAKADMDLAQQSYNTLQIKLLPDSQQLEVARQALVLQQNLYANLNAQYAQAIFRGDIESNEILAKQLFRVKNDLDQAQLDYDTLLAKSLSSSQELDSAQLSLQIQQDIYASLSAQYEQAAFRGETQANMMTIIEEASVPQFPFQPNAILNYALGFLIGLFGGLGLVFVFENLDTTLYMVEDIESAANMIAIANIPIAPKGHLNISKNSTTSLAEAFRNLATSVQMIDGQQAGKSLLIMSADPAQGKSMIVSNLAFSLAEYGKTVVVVDCDLRLPKQHILFGLTNDTGLVDVLEKRIPLQYVLQETNFQGVRVLTSGSNSEHPSPLLSSESMAKVIQELKKHFDYVLLDSPALLAVADVAIIAQKVDGLIQVVRQAHAKRESVQKAGKFLAGFPDKLVRLIVNQAESNHNFMYYQPHLKNSLKNPHTEHKILSFKS